MKRIRLVVLLAVGLAIGPWVAAALTSWWVLGDVSERNGYTQVLDLPQTAAAGRIALAAGIVVAIVSSAAVWVIHRRYQLPSGSQAVMIVAVLFGCATGYSFRIMSSRTYGANIGGGGLLLLWPIAALVLGSVAVMMLWRMVGSAALSSRPPAPTRRNPDEATSPK